MAVIVAPVAITVQRTGPGSKDPGPLEVVAASGDSRGASRLDRPSSCNHRPLPTFGLRLAVVASRLIRSRGEIKGAVDERLTNAPTDARRSRAPLGLGMAARRARVRRDVSSLMREYCEMSGRARWR